MPPKSNMQNMQDKQEKQDKLKFDIQVKEESYKKRHKFHSSHLTLILSGNDINHTIVNALRRSALNNIPIHAFPPELITITENTCIAYNNQYMKLRLSNLPVNKIKTDVFYLSEDYWKNINFFDPKRNRHPEEKNIDIYINAYNNSNQNKSITTNDIKYYVDGEEMNPYDKDYPILLINLRPNDTFKCNMKAALCIGNNNTRWCAASNCWYDYDDKNRFTFHIKSRCENDEYTLLIKSCKYLLKKISDFKEEFTKKEKTNEIAIDSNNCIEIELEGEDHTIGELLNYEFQSHPKIIFSGIIKPDLLIRSIVFKLQSEDKNIVTYMNQQLDILEQKINLFKHHFERLKN